jgi:ubiquinone/menaquinone biosynthesis C-methylase UbiE
MTKELEKIWQEYAECYTYFDAPLLSEVHREVASRIEGKKVVDLGSGVGKMVKYIDNTTEYVGIDSNDSMLAEGIKNYNSSPYISFQKGNVCNPDLPREYFTSAISVNVLYSLGSQENVNAAIASAYKLLAPNGVFIVMGLNQKLKPEYLEKQIKKQCKAQVVDKQSEKMFENFIKCNKVLASNQSKKYTPQLFEIDDLKNILKKHGFTEETQKLREHMFAGTGYVISVRKT